VRQAVGDGEMGRWVVVAVRVGWPREMGWEMGWLREMMGMAKRWAWQGDGHSREMAMARRAGVPQKDKAQK
jgi:hypothetical protein